MTSISFILYSEPLLNYVFAKTSNRFYASSCANCPARAKLNFAEKIISYKYLYKNEYTTTVANEKSAHLFEHKYRFLTQTFKKDDGFSKENYLKNRENSSCNIHSQMFAWEMPLTLTLFQSMQYDVCQE